MALLAPNGKSSNLTPEQYKLVRTPAFKAWFGDWENDPENASKVVDENGEPLVVYHNSNNEFFIFNTSGIIETLAGRVENEGVYFSPNKGMYNSKGKYEYNVFLNIKIPYYTSNQIENAIINKNQKNKIIKEGFDGTILKIKDNIIEFVVFEPTQVKLADGSNTTFDAANPDIRYEDGGELSDQVWYHKYSGEPFQYQKGSHNKYGDGIYFSNQQDSRFDGDEEIECIVKFKNPIVFEGRGLPNLKFHKARGKKTINDFADELFEEHDAIIVKHGGKFGDELIIRDANIISKKISHKHPDIRYEYGGATDFRVYRGYHPSKTFAEGGVSGRIDNAIDNKVNLSREQIADARLLAKQKINNEATNEPFQEAIQYNEYYGFPPLTLHKYKPSEKELQTEIAEIYPHLIGVTSPDYVETELERGIYNQYKSAYPEIFEEYKIKNYKDLVLKAYNQLAYEIDEQYRTLPIKVEYHQGDENYENSAEMFDDVHNYHHMWVYLGGEDHPTLGSITRDEKGLTANDKFRAVHDYYGHAVGGYEFGKNGEENAWIEHSKMLSPLAQWALSTESRGQNSYVNFSGINDAVLKRIERGSSLKKEGLKLKDEAMVAEGQAILNTVYDDFVFAEQKAIILPLKYTDFSRYHQPVIDYVPKKLNMANRYAGGGTTNKNLNLKNMQNKYHSLKPIDEVQVGDTYLLHEDSFGSSGEHKGERFITVEVMKPSEYTIGDYELKVLNCECSGTTPYHKGGIMHRSEKHLMRRAKLVDKAKKKSEAEKIGLDDIYIGDSVKYAGKSYKVGGISDCRSKIKVTCDDEDSYIEIDELMEKGILTNRI